MRHCRLLVINVVCEDDTILETLGDGAEAVAGLNDRAGDGDSRTESANGESIGFVEIEVTAGHEAEVRAPGPPSRNYLVATT
jgi:hypothetical protein